MQYSHRNGETEPPTIDEGYFWFDPGDNYINQPGGMLLIYAGASYEDGKMWVITELRGRWWGPVTPPWDDNPAPSEAMVGAICAGCGLAVSDDPHVIKEWTPIGVREYWHSICFVHDHSALLKQRRPAGEGV